MKHDKECDFCGRGFTTNRSHAIYCCALHKLHHFRWKRDGYFKVESKLMMEEPEGWDKDYASEDRADRIIEKYKKGEFSKKYFPCEIIVKEYHRDEKIYYDLWIRRLDGKMYTKDYGTEKSDKMKLMRKKENIIVWRR